MGARSLSFRAPCAATRPPTRRGSRAPGSPACRGLRAAVYLVLDRSGSMRPYYRDGTVRHLAEQALALAAHLDGDGTVPVVFFDTDAHPATRVSLDCHEGRVQELHQRYSHMGTTDYAAAMLEVIEHYTATGATAPAFVIFQTDGGPYAKREAERVLCRAARLPLFWQFVGFGDDRFAFLRKLDEPAVPRKRIVDKAGFFAAGPRPRSWTDEALYDALPAEFPAWLEAAGALGPRGEAPCTGAQPYREPR
ncbi:VWA domain-containing protein [Streptomyces koyangensis]|uniref:VWA domain-containing protein n=1 Tax=Streptomyces koyangensis TaxID=188770 RepID=UPI003C2E2BF8